jgi:uncharacterized membrane protein
MKSSTIAGLGLFAGAAAIEAALIPGLVLGAGVILIAKPLMSRRATLRKRTSAVASRAGTNTPAVAMSSQRATPAPFEVKQAIIKTITFRIIATSVDFTSNMVVIGNFGTAAGLSAFGLVGAPLFYFCHEVLWNRLAPAGTRVDVGALLNSNKTSSLMGQKLTMNRALAKTITYEVVTITVDFAANFVATGDVAVAGGLTIFAAAVSPIIYFGHEKLWEHFSGEASNNQTRNVVSPLAIAGGDVRFAHA